MVFSSFPVYLDHPNLHQFQQQAAAEHHHHHHGAGGIDISNNNENGQLPPASPPVPPPLPPHHMVIGGGGSIRPGSMVDRARLAKLPLPEAGLKCPRCDSTNTKFCYFNNYSLTQPRHFCKTCRRYWTRGGALRNVPVGGGCRRNKKSKSGGGSSSSKSSASSDHHRPINGNNNNNNNNNINNINNNSASTASPSSCTTDMVGHHHHHHFGQPSTQLPLMAALHNLHNQYGVVGSGVGGFQAQMVAAANGGGFNLEGGAEQWRLPSCIGAGFESAAAGATNLFPFHGEGVVVHDQAAPMVKSEETPHSGGGGGGGINLTKQFFVNSDNNQFWGTNSGGGGSGGGSPWAGFSGLNSSSTGHHLL